MLRPPLLRNLLLQSLLLLWPLLRRLLSRWLLRLELLLRQCRLRGRRWHHRLLECKLGATDLLLEVKGAREDGHSTQGGVSLRAGWNGECLAEREGCGR